MYIRDTIVQKVHEIMLNFESIYLTFYSKPNWLSSWVNEYHEHAFGFKSFNLIFKYKYESQSSTINTRDMVNLFIIIEKKNVIRVLHDRIFTSIFDKIEIVFSVVKEKESFWCLLFSHLFLFIKMEHE